MACNLDLNQCKEALLHHTQEISELKQKISKMSEMQPEHVTDKEYIGVLLAQIKEQQDAYVILYDRNVVLYKELTEAKNIIAAAKQALETHSSSQ
jgi:multidrug resistance efflux pump